MPFFSASAHRAAIALCIAFLFATGCSRCEGEIGESEFFDPGTFGEFEFDGEPEIEAPERVFLYDLEAGQRGTITAEVKNIGRADLKVSDWTISEGFELSFVDSLEAPDEIRPGESVHVAISYDAPSNDEARGTLTIDSNDADEPVTVVEIFVNAKFPCLETIPDDSVDFGEIEQDETAERLVEIRNCSENAATTFTVNGLSGDPEFQFAREHEFDRPTTLQVGESVSVVIGFQPQSAGEFSGSLDIISDDEFRPEHQVELRGVGAEGVCPSPVIVASHLERGEAVARPTGSLDALPLDRIRLTAERSEAYDGKIIRDFAWTLIRKPADSAASLAQGATNMTNELYLDLAGEYIVELDVVDSEGVDACNKARMTVRAVANEDIHIQLVWDTPNDPDQFDTNGSDVDLHFYDPNQPGAQWNDDPWDCFWQNLLPDWGEARPAGVDSVDCENDPNRRGCHDDPSLDIDDVDGWGPENINLNNPRTNWTYAIGVHYFSDHSYGASFATVRVYVGGILEAEYRRQRLLHDEFWYVADIDWPSATLSPRGEVLNDFPE